VWAGGAGDADEHGVVGGLFGGGQQQVAMIDDAGQDRGLTGTSGALPGRRTTRAPPASSAISRMLRVADTVGVTGSHQLDLEFRVPGSRIVHMIGLAAGGGCTLCFCALEYIW
jgi:hypothetical protein